MGFPGIVVSVWSIFMQLFLLMIASSSSALGGDEVDRLSLLAFKAEIVSDRMAILASWNESLHFCEWPGISCGRRHQRVTVLDLRSSRLRGQLSPNIGNLSFLRTLNLENNGFSNSIPPEIGRLFRLQQLRLGNNSFRGDIPVDISRCSKLRYLDLGDNILGGKIHIEISFLSNLQVLNLGSNNLSGEIPPSLGNLSKLQVLNLGSNVLSGEIPPSLGNLSNLQVLNLRSNHLSGEIPPSLGNLSKLQVLNLGSNGLSGEIPPSLGNLSSLQMLSVPQNFLQGGIPNSLGQLHSLKNLSLGYNNLNGTIPPSIYNLSSITFISVLENLLQGTLPPGLGHTVFPNLQAFYFHFNQFSGQIPVSISNASNLLLFGISENKFTGRVPSLAGMSNLFRLEIDANNLGNNEDGDLDFLSSLVNCTNLERLDISDNNFGGVLPGSLSNLSTKLEVMRLGENQIRGSIPEGIGNLINLGILGFEVNQLTGPIPISICKLNKIFSLSLNHNGLSGTIPVLLGNLTSLGRLVLKKNDLTGSIPPSLGECRNLQALDLSQNYLSGPIPHEVISLSSLSPALDLSTNQLTGSIPFEVGLLVNLASLDLSENQLSGDIPETLGSCISLTSLFLRDNLLQGTIPESFISLRGIEVIDLSSNKFIGGIPENLGSFIFLMNLDLSHNDFEGAVPMSGVFRNTSALHIEGNTRLCGGIPRLQLPKCNSNESKQKIFPWRKFLISFACGGSIGVILLLWCVILYPPKKALSFMLLYLSRKARLKLTLGSSWEVSLLKVSYGDLLEATNGFSSRNLIGAGSFGSVYRGIINQEERIVAVKVLNAHCSRESFIAECEALKNIRHRNLIKLLTVCLSIDFQGNDFKALVYEFMTNGNLEEWLHFSAHRPPGAPIVQGRLNLIQRVNIAIDVANALNYLHNQCHIPIVHCDLKPSNVLLEGDMTARVADFGLARYVQDASCSLPSHRSTANVINGSMGYIAPEYGMGNEVSAYGDVYSYGILLLEMLTGKRPTDEMFKDGLTLHNFVQMALPERVEEICDPVLLQVKTSSICSNATNNRNHVQDDQRQRISKCLVIMAKIGVACSADLPRERMDIGLVVEGLCLVRDVLIGTSIPINHMITA